ncbi:MAG: acyl-ACP thioesterase [Alphaproteobacteria bacterium]|nr:acyl-ACP thioesterase [Alphaproteobacteria bacterium]
MIEVYRGSVAALEIDEMGHMNVRFYVQKATEAMAVWFAGLGLGPHALRALGARLEIAESHIRYHREVRAGWPLAARAAPVAVGRRIRLFVELANGMEGWLSATIVLDVALRDASGAELAFPDAVLAAASARLAELPPTAAPRSVSAGPPSAAASRAEAERLGLAFIRVGAVHPSTCDLDGRLYTEQFVGLISDGIANFVRRFRPPASPQGGPPIGGAVLEYRMAYAARPRAGDVVAVCSGLKAHLDKVFVLVHWIVDMETGEALATAEAAAASFDLAARKLVPISAETRARMDGLIVPGLTM